MDEEPIWEVDEYGDEFLAVERMAPKCGSVRSAEAIHAEAEQLVFVRPSDVGADERALLGQLMRTTKLLQEEPRFDPWSVHGAGNITAEARAEERKLLSTFKYPSKMFGGARAA